jgi:hypothetical protein
LCSKHLKIVLPAALSSFDFECTTCSPTGFTKREESEYDPFGAGHSSTSISAGLGMAVGRDFKGKKNSVSVHMNPHALLADVPSSSLYC